MSNEMLRYTQHDNWHLTPYSIDTYLTNPHCNIAKAYPSSLMYATIDSTATTSSR
jgi:hypothetical protein